MQTNNNGFNLKVVYAENGYGCTIPVNPSVSLEKIKLYLSNTTGLSPSDQILLSDRNLSNPDKTLEAYGIIKDTEIYLFNKKIIGNYSLKPEEVDVSLQDFRKIPKRPAPNSLYEFESSPNPLNKLYALEYHFNNHLIGIKYIKDEFEKKLLITQNFQADISHQKRALNAASLSFYEYRDNLTNSTSKFFKDFRESIPKYESILSSFEFDINKLKQIKLHDSLRTNSRNTLADCIPEADFRKWHKLCKDEFEALKSKILDSENQMLLTIKNSDLELKRSDSINMADLSNRMQLLKEHFERVKVTNQSFTSNYDKIKQTLDQTRNMNDPNRISSMLLGFLDIKNQQDESFAYCSNNTNVFEAISYICKTKNHMNSYVYSHLRSISKFQDMLKEIRKPLALYFEAVTKFSGNFMQLEIIHRLPQAYEESILEINRRKKFGYNVTSSFTRFIESLKMIRDDENQKRQSFIDQYFRYIPIHSFIGLKEYLPDWSFNLPPFDTNLPNLGGGIGITSNSNSSGFSNGSGNSSGNNSSNGEDDGFTVIDNLVDNLNINNASSNMVLNQSSLINSNINNSSIVSGNNRKLLNDLEKSQIEKQQLEMKLHTTFLMASKSEEKYKDLLEKSKSFNDSFIDKQSSESKKIEELKKELDEKKREITILSDELAKLSEDNFGNQQTFITLHEEKNELQSKIDVLNLKIETSDSKLSQLQLEFTENQQLLNEKSKDCEKLQFEITDLQNKIQEFEETIIRLQFENEASIKESQQFQIENGQLKLEHTELKLQSSELIEKLDKLQSTTQLIQNETNELQSTIELLTKENDDLKNGTCLKSGELESKTKEFKETTEKLQLVNDKLKVSLDELKSENQLLQEDISRFQIEIQNSQQDYKSLQLDNSKLTERIHQFESSVDSLEKENLNLKNSTSTQLAEYELLRTELTKTSQSSQETFQEIVKLNKENQQLLKNQSSLEEQIIKLSDNNNQVLNEQIEEVEKSNLKINELTILIEQLTNDNSKLKIDLDAQNTQSTQSQSTLSSTLEQTKKQHELKLKELTQQLDQIKKQSDVKLSDSQSILEQTKKQYEVKLAELTQQYEVKLAESLEQNKKQYDVKLLELSKQVQLFEKEIAKTQQDSQLKENDSNNLKSEIETLSIQLEASKATEAKHSKDLEDLSNYFNGELTRVEADNDKLRIKNDEHLANLQSQKEMMKNDKIIHKKEMEALGEKDKLLFDKEKLLNDKDKIITDKDKVINELRNKLSVASANNLMPEVQSLRNTVYEISKIIDPSIKESLDSTVIISFINKLVLENILQNQQLLERVTNLENQLALERSQNAILSNFTHDRTAIFYRNKNNYYEALNTDSPHYFLSPLSFDQYTTEMRNGTPLIGSIIQVDCRIAGNSDSFGCLPGTEIYEVLVSKPE